MAEQPGPPAERINLVVLFGGQSAEHDVSRVTAAHVLRAVDPERYAITAVGISRDGEWLLAESATAALGPAADPLALPYVGSGVLGSALAMDKAMAKQVLAQQGIAQSRWLSFTEHEVGAGTADEVIDALGLPVFVKPANMGSSVCVTKAKSRDALTQAIDLALSYDERVVVEEAIVGREIEVAVLGNEHPRASVPGEIVPGHEFYDYDDKYVDDGARLLVPAPLDEGDKATVQALALEVFRALRCDGMARIDFLFEEGGRGFLCNEANTIPGFTPISMYPKLWQASGLSYAGLIDELVRLAVERHGRRRRNTKR